MTVPARLASLAVLALLGGCPAAEVAASGDTIAKTDVSTCDPAQCTPTKSYGMRVGTNPIDRNDFTAFQEFSDGQDVQVILGTQGAWMVVLAAATDLLPCCADRINIKAQLTRSDGFSIGTLGFKKRPMAEVGDGVRYMPNVWFVVGQPSEWKDQQATLTVELEPYGGGEIAKRTVNLTLRQGQAAATPTPFGLQVGTNVAGETDTASFNQAKAEERVPVVLGPQGAYMLVLAAATDQLPADVERVNINAKLEDATSGTIFGEVDLKKRPTFVGPNGVRYILNVQLVVGEPAIWAEKSALLTVDLEPYGGGTVVSQSVPVVLYDAATATTP